MKTGTAALAALLLMLGTAGEIRGQGASQPSDFPDIKNFLRIDKRICTGGQPTMQDLARLKTEGVRAIVNLRRPSEYNAAEEAAKAEELGLHYISIPVDPAAPTDEEADDFLKALADPNNYPAFIHCTTANRVGAFWLIRRVLVDGWKLEDAEAEARKIGTHTQVLFDFARSYVARHAKKAAAAKPLL